MITIIAGFAMLVGMTISARAAEVDRGTTVLQSYERVATALANDNLDAAKSAAAALQPVAETAGQVAIARMAGELAKADSLKEARESFKGLAGPVAKLAEGRSDWYVMMCPMANARWVQLGKDVANPYLGMQMRTCGEIVSGKAGR